MWPLLALLGPRILIPSFFLGPKVAAMDDHVEIAQTIALSILFITFAFTLFTKHAWLSLIPGITAWAYWNMLRDPTNQDIYQYMDWAITTPIILIAILYANGASTQMILGIVVLFLITIGIGYVGVQQTNKDKKNMLFILGFIIFLPILYILFHQHKTKAAIYLILIIWSIYPLIWYANEVAIIKKETTTILYAMIDVIEKVGVLNLLIM
jgi:bacteriorhodopsin